MEQLSGAEHFICDGTDAGIAVEDYWKWAYSDLLSNTSRGAMAEFIVRSALGITDNVCRVDWTPYDLTSLNGRRVEVKSASYVQSWNQRKPSYIQFNIAPKRAWHPNSGYEDEVKRQSDIYVFCLYKARRKEQSILDLNLWEFYVLPTYMLNELSLSQKTIGISGLTKLGAVMTGFSSLRNAVETVYLDT